MTLRAATTISFRSILSRRTKSRIGFGRITGPDVCDHNDDRNDGLEKQRMVCVCVCVCLGVRVGESGKKWDSGRVKQVFASPKTSPEPRPGRGNVIAGAVRAVMESLRVAVHM